MHVHIYGKLQNFIQLSLNLTQLCHIKCKTALQLTRPVIRRTGWGPTVPTSSQRMNGHQIHQTSTHLTIMCGVQCFRHFTNFTQSPRIFQSSKVHCSRSGMTCRRQRSTKLLMTLQTSERMRLGRWWTCWTYDMNIIQKYFDWTLFAVSETVINCVF